MPDSTDPIGDAARDLSAAQEAFANACNEWLAEVQFGDKSTYTPDSDTLVDLLNLRDEWQRASGRFLAACAKMPA